MNQHPQNDQFHEALWHLPIALGSNVERKGKQWMTCITSGSWASWRIAISIALAFAICSLENSECRNADAGTYITSATTNGIFSGQAVRVGLTGGGWLNGVYASSRQWQAVGDAYLTGNQAALWIERQQGAQTYPGGGGDPYAFACVVLKFTALGDGWIKVDFDLSAISGATDPQAPPSTTCYCQLNDYNTLEVTMFPTPTFVGGGAQNGPNTFGNDGSKGANPYQRGLPGGWLGGPGGGGNIQFIGDWSGYIGPPSTQPVATQPGDTSQPSTIPSSTAQDATQAAKTAIQTVASGSTPGSYMIAWGTDIQNAPDKSPAELVSDVMPNMQHELLNSSQSDVRTVMNGAMSGAATQGFSYTPAMVTSGLTWEAYYARAVTSLSSARDGMRNFIRVTLGLGSIIGQSIDCIVVGWMIYRLWGLFMGPE